MSWRCRLFGHRTGYHTTFNVIGRHVEVEKCTRCDYEREAFTGPIFPGEADDPEKAVRFIKHNEDYDPEDTFWTWDGVPGLGLDGSLEREANRLLEEMDDE